MSETPTKVNLSAGSDLEFLKNLLNHSDAIDHETLIARVFAPENLDRIIRLQAHNPGADVIISEALKAQKIPLGKLEQAVTQRQRALRDAKAEAEAQAKRQQFYAVQGQASDESLPLPAGCAMPKGYAIEPGATVRIDPEEGRQLIAPGAIAILDRYRDIDSGITQVRVGTWPDTAARWHTVDTPRKTIFDTRGIMDLANYDFPVSSLNAKFVVEYFVQYEIKNRRAIPEHLTASHLGWQKINGDLVGFLAGPKTFIGVGEHAPQDIQFLPENLGDGQVASGFTSAGTLDHWITQVAQPILQHPKATIAMLASFGTPLLQILHHPNFVVDYSGLTSLGKTTTQRAAGSVWGITDEAELADNVIQSWNATQVGASELGRVLSGLPVIFDDSKTARSAKSVAEILYLVANGKGRAKGAKNGGLRQTPTTKTILISSGEQPITKFTKDGGLKTRTLVIEGSPFGQADDSTRVLTQSIATAAIDHHGIAGTHWIQWVCDHQTEWGGWIQEYRTLKERYGQASQSAGEGRLSAHRAFLESVAALVGQSIPALAKAISTVTHGPEWGALWSAMTAQAADPNEDQSALEAIGSWMQSHIELFEGQRSAGMLPPNEWLGRWEGETLALLKHTVHDQLEEWGYEPEAIIRGWRAKGWLLSGEDGHHADPRMTIAGQRGRNAYVLSPEGLAVALAAQDEDLAGLGESARAEKAPF